MRAAIVGLSLLVVACASPRTQEAKPEGTVVLEVTIGARGDVARTKLVSEDPKGRGFADASAKAVKKYKFDASKPGTYRITIKFRLDENGEPVAAP
jgi:TonB family protein